MHRQSRSWYIGTVLVAVLLCAGLMVQGATPKAIAPQNHGKAPVATAHHGAAANVSPAKTKTPGQAPKDLVRNMPADVQSLFAKVKASGIKARDLGKITNLHVPVYKQFLAALAAKGVDVTAKEKKALEALCTNGDGWFGGPAMAANTNGTANVWAAGLYIYFAAASDPTSYAYGTLIGDIPMRVYFQGNIAMIQGFVTESWWDVTDPTAPAFISGTYAGFGTYGYTGLMATPDSAYIVSINYIDEVDFWTIDGDFLGWTDLESLFPAYPWAYLPQLVDIVIPATPGNVAIITDWDNYYVHFIDLSDLLCAGPQYLGYINDEAEGDSDVGQLIYQAPFLYMTYEPWFYYNPYGLDYCPGAMGTYYVDIFSVPDVNDPTDHLGVKYFSENGTAWDDVTSMSAIGNGKIALGFYTGKVVVWDTQMNNVLDWGWIAPHWDGGWCNSLSGNYYDYFSLQMGYAGSSYIMADWAGGANTANTANLDTLTAHIFTGDWSENPVVAGGTLYVPQQEGGMALLDLGTPDVPVLKSFLPTAPGMPRIDVVSVTGNRAFVANRTLDTTLLDVTPYVFAVDVTDTSAPAYLSTASTAFDVTTDDATNPSAGVFSLETTGGLCIIGTDNGIDFVDFSDPSAPVLVKKIFTYSWINSYGGWTWSMAKFTMPQFPVSSFLAVTEGDFVEVIDITPPGASNPCPFPLYSVCDLGLGFPAFATCGYAYSIAVNGSYLYYGDRDCTIIGAIHMTPNISSNCVAGEITFDNVGAVDLAVPVDPSAMVNAGVVGGVNVLVFGDAGYAIGTGGQPFIFLADISTNPVAPAGLPSNSAIMWNSLTGLAYANGWVYMADQAFGVDTANLVPGFVPPTVAVPTTVPAPGAPPSQINGTITLSVKVTAGDTAVEEVDFTYWDGSNEYTIAAIPVTIAAGAAKTVTYTWNSSAWTHACGPFQIYAYAYDAGCLEGSNNSGAQTWQLSLPPVVTIDTTSFTPPVPTGGVCVAAGSYIVCGIMSFDAYATDNACNIPNGISQMVLYVDGAQYTYINNPPFFAGTTYIWAATNGLEIDTTTLTDGEHYLQILAADAAGLQKMSKKFYFTVHNIGPHTVVTAPVSGNVVSGTAIVVAATATVSDPTHFGVQKVVFWLDDGSSTPVKLGTATAPTLLGGNLYQITWDSTATGTNTGYGNHTIRSYAYDNAGACQGIAYSDIVSFNLIEYSPMVLTATAAPTSGNAPLTVAFNTTVTGGAAPFVYAWSFGDGATGTGASTTHIYTTVGTFTWTVTVTDVTGVINQKTATGTITTTSPIIPPIVSAVQKVNDASGFRLKIFGANIHGGCTVRINGVAVPQSVWKSNTQVNAKGSGLKSMVPKGVTVQITVKNNDDGGVSANFPYTR